MTNWFTSDEQRWKNKETGEVIEFEHIKDTIEVWIYKTASKERGQKVRSGANKPKAIKKAKEFAKDHEDTRWFKPTTH